MTVNTAALHAASTYVRLQPDGRVEQLPVGPEFWPNLMAGKLGDFHNEYLVTLFTFTENWTTWEQHPNGDEIVLMLNGAIDFVLDTPGGEQTVPLRQSGEYAVVPKGTWHTANVVETTMMLFITAGEGTGIKPRA